MCLPAVAGAIGSFVAGNAGALASGALAAGGQYLASRESSDAISDAQRAQTQQFNQTLNLLRPRIQAGDAAIGQMMSELGLGSAAGYGGGQSAGGADYSGYLDQYGDVRQWAQSLSPRDQAFLRQQGFDANNDGRIAPNEAAAYHFNTYGQGEGRRLPSRAPATNPGGVTGTVSGEDRFDRFRETPGYQFMMTEGRRAIEGSAAARGRLLSGNTLKRLQEYGQGVADQTYGRYFNRLANIAGLGNQAAGIAANVNMNQGNNLANAALAGGANTAATIGGIGGSLADILGGLDWGGASSGGGKSSYGGFKGGTLGHTIGGG